MFRTFFSRSKPIFAIARVGQRPAQRSPLCANVNPNVSFCTGSHDDFKPQRNAPPMNDPDSVNSFIEKSTKENKIMVFMKGTPEAPQCGFSGQVVRILHAEGVEFASANVLEDNDLREGIKTYSNWPTVPQVYIDGEFVGGCDIMTQLYQSGELEEMLNKE
eukprot:g485.t1